MRRLSIRSGLHKHKQLSVCSRPSVRAAVKSVEKRDVMGAIKSLLEQRSVLT